MGAPEGRAPDLEAGSVPGGPARTLPDQDGGPLDTKPDLEPGPTLRGPGQAVPDQDAAAASGMDVASTSAESVAAGRLSSGKRVSQGRDKESRCHGGMASGEGETGSLGGGNTSCKPDHVLVGPSGGVPEPDICTSRPESVRKQQSSAHCHSVSNTAGGESSLGQADGVKEGPSRAWQGGPTRTGSRTSFVLCSESEEFPASNARPQRSRSSVIFAGSSSTPAV